MCHRGSISGCWSRIWTKKSKLFYDLGEKKDNFYENPENVGQELLVKESVQG